MTEITKEQKIAVLVYKEDHPELYPPEISEATGLNYDDVIHILREHEASKTRYKVKIKTEFFSYEEAMSLVEAIKAGGDEAEVENVTPCAFYVNGRNGHKFYCEATGEHECHRVEHMGLMFEFDKDGKRI